MKSALAFNLLLALVPVKCSSPSHDNANAFGIRFIETPPSSSRQVRARRQVDNATPPIHLPLRRVPSPSWKPHWLETASDLLHDSIDGPVNSTRMTYWRTSQYVGNISLGSQDFTVVMDSGSSDTWVVHEDFVCIDNDSKPLPADYCAFGPTFKGTFSHGAIPGVNISVLYAHGDVVRASAGREDVTIAGITVKKQRVGLAHQVFGGGDGTSGVLGLAYPVLTQAFVGGNDTDRNPGSGNQDIYDPIFTTMSKQGLVVPPYFSMAMDRNHTGWLTFGAAPPVAHSSFSNAPIEKAEVYNLSSPTLLAEYSFYTIVADDYILGSRNASDITSEKTRWSESHKRSRYANQFPVVVDSGSTLAAIPSAHAEAFAAQFDPPAVLNVFTAEYWAPCTAKVPKFGVVIGGQAFLLYEEDVLLQEVKLDWNGDGVMFCRLGIKDGYGGPYVLGDVFLNRVVTVFDVGIGEMHFAPRL